MQSGLDQDRACRGCGGPNTKGHICSAACLPVFANEFWKRWVTFLMPFSLMASCRSFIFRRSACSTARDLLEAAGRAKLMLKGNTAGSTSAFCQPTFTCITSFPTSYSGLLLQA